MLRPRIIPCLLITNGGLGKTVKFKNSKYVGDPINAVKIFNEKEVDEIMVIDIDATVKNKKPDFRLISDIAAECRMPLCYGGGVKTAEQVQKIISLGVEKVAISSSAIECPDIISEAAERVGNQSVVVVMDIKRKSFSKKYEVVTHNGLKTTGIDPVLLAEKIQKYGAGEIVINSVDKDGTMEGYDIEIIRNIRDRVTLPITVLGGAGSNNDLKKLIKEFGIIGASAGSIFVFRGKYKAVLINYPNVNEKEDMYKEIKYNNQ